MSRNIPWTVAIRMGIASAILLVSIPNAVAQVAGTKQAASQADTSHAESLDRVIAVVNNEVILASDLDLEIRVSHLLPLTTGEDPSQTGALQRLITRALIEQQITQEDPRGLEIAPNDLHASLDELRQALPGCKAGDCTTPAGWSSYLATFDVTPGRFEEYWARRMAMLRFIELRFRSGIRIAPEDVQKFYEQTLIPQYSRREDAPPLEKVSARIQEILLERQVNALLNDWLQSLQAQGQVEILDPTLQRETPAASRGEVSDDTPSVNGGRP